MDSDLQFQGRLGSRYDAVRDMRESRIVEQWALISNAEGENGIRERWTQPSLLSNVWVTPRT